MSSIIRKILDIFYIELIKPIKKLIFKYKWYLKNPNSNTKAINIFPMNKVSVGKYTYGPLDVRFYGNDNESLLIGSYCCISEGVKFILGGEHHPEYLSNYPFYLNWGIGNDLLDRNTKGPIIIEDDVWIGFNSIILSGVKIGQGAIIAAGSVVTKDVPAYSIYTTNKILKYRFSPEICSKLKKFDYSNLNKDDIIKNIDNFYKNVTHDLINEKFIQKYMKDE